MKDPAKILKDFLKVTHDVQSDLQRAELLDCVAILEEWRDLGSTQEYPECDFDGCWRPAEDVVDGGYCHIHDTGGDDE